MITKGDKNKARLKRHLRVRKKNQRYSSTSASVRISFFQAHVCSIDR